ncbi:CaiB/BaiF CoA transferase family protein [Chloroflexota bacterium]
MSQGKLPLRGIRIVDFYWVAAGPRSSRVFANLGAEVIKMESIARLDLSRGRPPFRKGTTGINAGLGFNNGSVDKLSATLNMSRPEAREIAKKLIAISDVVTDNYTPHVMDNWGLGYDELVKIKPDIIQISMPVMGKEGPRSHYGGYGMGITAASGINYLTGRPDRAPVGTGIAYSDAGPNPRHATIALLAALHYRNVTGKGQFIEIPQNESTICYTGTAILDYAVNGRLQRGMSNHSPYACPHAAYRCKGDDRWCVIAVFNQEEWLAFCDVIGNPEWVWDSRFATCLSRKESEEELDQLIEEWTQERTPEEVMMQMQLGGVAAGIVQDGADLLDRDHQLRAREQYVTLDHPEIGVCHVDNVPFRLSETPGQVRHHAPLLGQDNDYVYRELLGMSEEEMDRLIVEEIIY